MKNAKMRSVIEDKRVSMYKENNKKKSQLIEGVHIIPLKETALEKNSFEQIIKLKDGIIEAIPHFRVAQINRVCLLPGTIKAWHLHFMQDEIWYVHRSDRLIVGLWDIRKYSTSLGVVKRFSMGGGVSELLHIPYGVAHGSYVISDRPVDLYVFVSQHFNIKNPDEKRMPWNSLGDGFWTNRTA